MFDNQVSMRCADPVPINLALLALALLDLALLDLAPLDLALLGLGPLALAPLDLEHLVPAPLDPTIGTKAAERRTLWKSLSNKTRLT